jgi:site-specific recombinase XerD
MRRHPEQAHELLARVDPARHRWGWPVGLRDGAVLALLAAGITIEELADLQASAVTMERGILQVHVHRKGYKWSVTLPPPVGGRLLAWLTESRLWATAEPVAKGFRGRLTLQAIRQILYRYRERKTPR